MLHLFAFLLLSAALLSEGAPVLDVDGNALQTASEYYILPVIRGSGGGLTLAALGDNTCPVDVVQDLLELDLGMPVRFLPVADPAAVTVELWAHQKFVFSAPPNCAASGVWRMERSRVVVGGMIDANLKEPSDNWFRVVESEDGLSYNLQFCPCRVICRRGCSTLGVGFDEATGYRYLGTGENGFPVMFKKVEAISAVLPQSQ